MATSGDLAGGAGERRARSGGRQRGYGGERWHGGRRG